MWSDVLSVNAVVPTSVLFVALEGECGKRQEIKDCWKPVGKLAWGMQ